MTETLGVLGGERGNIQFPLPTTVVAKNGQVPQRKNHFFTWNNYTEEQIGGLVAYFDKHATKYAFQEELAPTTGTPHLQGMVMFPKETRSTVFDPKSKACWLALKKTDGVYQLKEESRKPGGRQWSKGLPKPIKLINPDRQWEIDILEIIKNEPDDRTIHWYWSKSGKVGKTCFCKYLTVKKGAIILSGKSADMKNGVVDYYNSKGDYPELIIIPIPRSFNTDYLNYEGMEIIKDMLFYSGKYEGGMVAGNCPHLFVFANIPPDKSKMSIDRWIVTEILPDEIVTDEVVTED